MVFSVFFVLVLFTALGMIYSLFSFFTAVGSTAVLGVDYTPYVKTFMGTEGGGNDFPGVSRPNGMVKLGPDLLSTEADAYSGYLPQGNFSGFSMMHEQGTGGAPKYGTVSQLSLVGTVSDPLSNITVGRVGVDEATVGYYRAQTNQGVTVELAATTRAGMYQYTFPVNSTENHVLIDVSHVLPSSRGQGLGQGYAGGEFSFARDGHYEGYGIYNNGWNRSPDWTIYFCGYFNDTAVAAQAYTSSLTTGTIAASNGSATAVDWSTAVGGMYTFERNVVTSRVGISWISVDQACQNVNDQIPEKTAFNEVVQQTKDSWNTEVFSKITTNATNTTSLELLYSSLYFMNLIQTNQTGENPGWTSDEPYYSDIFTFWDLFRCSTSLLQIIRPKIYEEQIRSLIDIWRHDDYLPDARSSNYNGRTQVGSNADNILADAYVKGVRGKVNWNDGYAAMVTDAEIPPPNTIPPDPQAPDSSTKDGRGALPDWLTYGFITPTYTRAASRALEYAYNDFSLHQVALGLNENEDAAKYLNRSRNWRNHWDPTITSLNHTGFIMPRNTTTFLPYSPLKATGYWGSPFYEGSSWSYSWAPTHDIAHLITLMGGPETFLSRLDTMFTPGANPKTPNATIFDATNEVTFTVPYLYNFLNLPNRSVLQSRTIAKTLYSTSANGLPGNSDAGAMQTWLLWNMIGLYPITGQTTFLIHAPWFEQMTIELGDGKKLEITSRGGDGNGDRDFFVQSLKINGKMWDRAWLEWRDVFESGGTLEFVLGPNEVLWATGELPPSPAS